MKVLSRNGAFFVRFDAMALCFPCSVQPQPGVSLWIRVSFYRRIDFSLGQLLFQCGSCFDSLALYSYDWEDTAFDKDSTRPGVGKW